MRILKFFLLVSWIAALSCPALAQTQNLKELSNDFIRVTQVKEDVKKNQEFVRQGDKVELKDVEYKQVKVVAELSKKPDATLENMIRQSEKDPSLKICLTPYGPDGKAGDEICQPLAFSQLTSGNLGSTAFILPLDTARYVLKVNKHRPSSDSGFKIEVGNPGK